MKRHLLIKLFGMAFLFVSLVAFTPSAFAASTPKQTASPNGYACNPGWYYDNLTFWGKPLAQVGPTYRDYNGTNSNADMTLTSTVSGTITLTVSANVEVDAGVILTGVKVSLGFSVSYSLTATTSNQFHIVVPPHKAGYGAYGVFRVQSSGHYYYRHLDCSIGTDDGYIMTYSPWYVGWNTWIGN